MLIQTSACALIVLAPFGAQDPGPVPELPPAPEVAQDPLDAPPLEPCVADLTQDRRRVLHLAGGRVVRDRARNVNGTWEVFEQGDWRVLPATVLRHAQEKMLLSELARRQRALKGTKAEVIDKRLNLAGWALAQGLEAESLRHLDHVMRGERDHPGVIELLERVPLPSEHDPQLGRGGERILALLIRGASGTPATEEACLHAIARSLDREQLRKWTPIWMLSAQNGRRAFACTMAQRKFPGELLRELSERAMLDNDRPVRHAAARALRASGEPGVLGPAINALASQHANVRANAAEALGNLGSPAAVEPLMARLAAIAAPRGTSGHPGGTRASSYIGNQLAYVSDYDVEIAQGASIADPIVSTITSGVVFDVRVQVQMSQVVELRRVIGALGQLTGEKRKAKSADWLEWWEENKADWRSLDRIQEFPRSTPK